jgi:putative transposase
VKPATILAWFRQLAAKKYDSSKTKRGRPPKPKDMRKVVVEMALANPAWGTPRSGTRCAPDLPSRSVAPRWRTFLAEAGIEPGPEREKKRTWKRFIKAHWDSL